MAKVIQEVAVKQEALGKKIKAVFTREMNVYENGQVVDRGRVFTASSKEQRDFEIIVAGLKNSVVFEGKQEISLIAPKIRIQATTNNWSGKKAMNLVVDAEKLEVVG
ncbi:hypothetical protein ACYSNR_09265 [Enterococcus sp. LJL128]